MSRFANFKPSKLIHINDLFHKSNISNPNHSTYPNHGRLALTAP